MKGPARVVKRSGRSQSSDRPRAKVMQGGDEGIVSSEVKSPLKMKKKKKKLDLTANPPPSAANVVVKPERRRSIEDEEKQFMEEAVVNSLQKPKRIKKKKVQPREEKPARREQEDRAEVKPTRVTSSQREEDDEDNYDDDDFEDYDDDFEDDEQDELQVFNPVKASALKSPKARNQFAPSLRSSSKREEKQMDDASGAKMGKFTQVQMQKAKGRTKATRRSTRDGLVDLDSLNEVGISFENAGYRSNRNKEIRSLVKLQQCKIDVFSHHALPKWEFYMRTVGAGGTCRQTFTQTNDDACDMGIQTDGIEVKTSYVGGDDGGDGEPMCEEKLAEEDLRGLGRLTEMCEILLEENSALFTGKEETSFSACEFVLGNVPGDTVDIVYSATLSHVLLSAHVEGERSTLCLWDLNNPETPFRVAICEDVVTKCLLSPRNPNVLIAGSESGVVFVWDMRNVTDSNPVKPTYCTAACDEMHESGICELRLVQSSMTRGYSDFGFQFASLDTYGVIHIWSVLNHTQQPEQDHGIFLGGTAKLLHVDKVVSFPEEDAMATSFQFHPSDASQIFVTSTCGRIVHLTRFGTGIPPKSYDPGVDAGLRYSMVDIFTCGIIATSIDFHPILENYFLVGFSTGSFALYHVGKSPPLKVWQATTQADPSKGFGFSGVSRILWSKTTPTVFFVYDELSTLYLWNLKQDPYTPAYTQHSEKPPTMKTLFAVSPSLVKVMSPSLTILDPAGDMIVHKLHSLGPTTTQVEKLLLDLF